MNETLHTPPLRWYRRIFVPFFLHLTQRTEKKPAPRAAADRDESSFMCVWIIGSLTDLLDLLTDLHLHLHCTKSRNATTTPNHDAILTKPSLLSRHDKMSAQMLASNVAAQAAAGARFGNNASQVSARKAISRAPLGNRRIQVCIRASIGKNCR